MSKAVIDPMGDAIKALEARYEQRVASPGQFLLARADGRAFHTFTKNMRRPFDSRMSEAMLHTTKELCHMFNARLAYTQSDEITLCFYYDEADGVDYPFGGRLQKMCSLIAAQATVLFFNQIIDSMPEKRNELPIFDCRVFKAVTFETAFNSFIWRERDARKNAVSMAASSVYAERELSGIGTGERLKLLDAKGITFNDYPTHFKKGAYFHRQERREPLDAATLARIPAGKGPADGLVTRRSVEQAKFASLLELGDDELNILFGTQPDKLIAADAISQP